MTAKLNQLLNKGEKWSWTEAHEADFQELKPVMVLSHVQVCPNQTNHLFFMSTRATVVVGACVIQDEHPVKLCLKRLSTWLSYPPSGDTGWM
jgi:hypothetical protein